MVVQLNDNQQSNGTGGLNDRFGNYWQDKNDWKNINGGCPIKADLKITLQDLKANCQPVFENLPAMVRSSVEKNDKQRRSLEQIWMEKIAEGASHVGVIDGVFHFFKGEEIIPEDNVDMRIPVMPPILQFRETEKQQIKEKMSALRKQFREGLKDVEGQDAVPVMGTDSVTKGGSQIS